MSTPVDRLFGWTPFRAAFHGGRLMLDWCHLGGRRMVEPFFYGTVAEAMREPFNLAFQQRTLAEILADLPRGLPVGGFVFHMTRCGSTLVSQMLAAFENNIVASEPAPLHAALRAASSGRASPERARDLFAGLVNAYAQPRFSYEQRLFVKIPAADALDMALVRRAFPDVPWVFVTRDPAEILASHDRSTGLDVIPGQIDPHRLGLTVGALQTMEPAAYQAQVLAALGRAALDAHALGGGLIVDHSELPDAVWTRILPHFGLMPDAGAVAAMRAMGRHHAKVPGTPFEPGRDPNRAGAAPFRPVAERIVGPVMDALRAAGAAAPNP